MVFAANAGKSANALLAIAAPLLFFFLVMVENISAFYSFLREEGFSKSQRSDRKKT